ncbi:MAG: hypothetical protein GXY77_18500 [Fibrobacter sp.]|nr:hypothetical protein [Fibrobacter sp.]
MIIKCIRILSLILIYNSILLSKDNSNIERDTIKQNECTEKEIGFVLKDKASMHIKSFEQLLGIMNHNFCKTDSLTLRKLLINIASNKNPDSSYSSEDYEMFKSAWFYVTRRITWDKDVEEFLLKDIDYYRKYRKSGYYGRIKVLVKRSPNWYQYMLETYNSIDTMNYSDRYWIYWALIERFKDTSDTSVQNKVESILYAVMKKDCGSYYYLDEYFAKSVPGYKNSNQRKEIFKKCGKAFTEIPESSGYKIYLRKVEKEMEETKKFSNYSPPFTID